MASTTQTSLNNSDGVAPVFVLEIEGYEYLVSDYDDTAAVVTAWSGSDWSKCLPGLIIDASREEAIEPWSDKIATGSRTFGVRELGADIFGTAVHADGAGNETYLTSTLDPDDSTSITCTNNGDFATSGDIFIGPECISYSSVPTAQNFNGSINRGKYAPFEADTAANWGRYHSLPSVDNTNVQTKLKITDQPRTWVGKQVALYICEVKAGVLATKANSFLLFAGTIDSTADDANMTTWLSCSDIRRVIKDAVLLRDQFVGRVADGVYIDVSMVFSATSHNTTADTDDDATDLTVKASGASGANEIDAGIYTVEQVIEFLNEWLASEVVALRLHSTPHVFSLRTVDDKEFVNISIENTFQGYGNIHIPVDVSKLMGLESTNSDLTGRYIWDLHLTGNNYSATLRREPYRLFSGVNATRINLSWSTGTWFNNRDWLPDELIAGAPTGENWGLLRVGASQMALVQYSSDTAFIEVKWLNSLSAGLAGGAASTELGINRSDNGYLEVKQVAILHGSLEDVMLRLLCSTGASGYSHATYDDWPFHLGCAVPWGLLGTGMTDSLSALAESTQRNALTIMLDKPESFEKVIGVELLLRGAFLVWKEQGLQFVQLPTPNSDVATHTLTEANKATPAGAQDANRTVTETTDKHLRNVIVIHYNRDVEGAYRDSVTIRHESSISRYGVRKVEIKARNAYGHWAGPVNVIESLIADLAAYTLPLFAEPFKIMHRSIDLNKYVSMFVGDIANVTDLYARDPATGARGITGKPSLVLSTEYDMGGEKGPGQVEGMTGKVTLGFAPLDNTAVIAPAALFDDTATNNGYQADTPIVGQSTLTFYGNTYSLSGETHDVGRFSAGDFVNIHELDFTGGGSPLNYAKEIFSVDAGTDTCILTSNLAAFDNTSYYRMTFDNYTACQTSQKGHSFQADTDDGQVEDVRVPFEYGYQGTASGQVADLSIAPMRPYDGREVGDGESLNSGYSYNLAALANQIQNYKTAPSGPALFSLSGVAGTTSSTVWKYMTGIPFDVGQSKHEAGGKRRKLYIAPWAGRTGGASAVQMRITLTAALPNTDTVSDVDFGGGQQSHTWDSVTDSPSIIQVAHGFDLPRTTSGVLWINIETLGNGTGGIFTYGLGTVYLGPMEAV